MSGQGGTVPGRRKWNSRLLIPAALLVIALSFGLWKASWVSTAPGPYIFGDETTYWRNAFYLQGERDKYNTQYPPLYSFVISPAAVREGGYNLSLAVNCLIHALLPLIAYVFARRYLPRLTAFLLALLITLIPYSVVMPRFIMSENLFTPIFLATLYFICASWDRPWPNLLLTGVLTAAGYLTRYLGLMVIPVVGIVWVCGFLIRSKNHELANHRPLNQASREIVALAFGFLVILLPWLIYIRFAQSVSFLEALGLTRHIVPRKDRIAALEHYNPNLPFYLKWASVYVSYVVLALGPLITGLLSGLFLLVFRRSSIQRRDWELATVVFAACFIFINLAAQHSWKAAYNHRSPELNYILGRYVTFIVPLLTLAAVAGIYWTAKYLNSRFWRMVLVCCASLLALGSLWVAHAAIIAGSFFPITGWFSNLAFNTPDIMHTHNDRYLRCSGFALCLWLLILIAAALIRYRHAPHLLSVSYLMFLIPFFGWANLTSARAVANQQRQAGAARMIADFVRQQGWSKNESALFISNINWPPASTINSGISFWGIGNRARAVAYRSPDLEKHIDRADYIFLLSNANDDIDTAPTVYRYSGLVLRKIRSASRMKITNWGPKTVQAGRPFNVHGGMSTIWIRATGVTSPALLEVNGETFKPVIAGGGTSISCGLPEQFFDRPGTLTLRLISPIGFEPSNEVSIHVVAAE